MIFRKTHSWRGLATSWLWFHYLTSMWMIFSTWGKDHACQGAVFDSDDFSFCIINIKKGGRGTLNFSVTARPRYRKNANPKPGEDNSLKTRRENSLNAQLISQKSRTLKWEIQQYKAVQVSSSQCTSCNQFCFSWTSELKLRWHRYGIGYSKLVR